MTHVTIPTASLTELRARVEKAEADAAHWMAVADLNLVSWTKQSVRAWGHDLTRESLTGLLAAAEECGRDLELYVQSRRDMAPVDRLRAAVARGRGE